MKNTLTFLIFLFLIHISVFAQKGANKEVVFQVQNASAGQITKFTYGSLSGTANLFDSDECIYDSVADFSFTHSINGFHHGTSYYASIILSDDAPVSIFEMLHCLLQVEIIIGTTVKKYFFYDTRDCQYYTACEQESQDITIRYDRGKDEMWYYKGINQDTLATTDSGWVKVNSGVSKNYWTEAEITHCPLDFEGAPDTPSNFSVSGSDGENPQLDWDDNDEPDLVGYYLYRNYNGGAYLLFDSVSAPTNTYTDNIYEILYGRFNPSVCYKIKAYDEEELESSQTSQGCRNVVADKRALQQNNEEIVNKYKLYRAYPNPFNPSTRITFQIPKSGYLNLSVSDVNGRLVETLISESKPEGLYNITFYAKNLSSGIYYYTLRTSDFISTKKMLFVK